MLVYIPLKMFHSVILKANGNLGFTFPSILSSAKRTQFVCSCRKIHIPCKRNFWGPCDIHPCLSSSHTISSWLIGRCPLSSKVLNCALQKKYSDLSWWSSNLSTPQPCTMKSFSLDSKAPCTESTLLWYMHLRPCGVMLFFNMTHHFRLWRNMGIRPNRQALLLILFLQRLRS